jgi:hypothetical protein
VFEGRSLPPCHMVPSGHRYATEPFLDRYGLRDVDMAVSLLTALRYLVCNHTRTGEQRSVPAALPLVSMRSIRRTVGAGWNLAPTVA